MRNDLTITLAVYITHGGSMKPFAHLYHQNRHPQYSMLFSYSEEGYKLVEKLDENFRKINIATKTFSKPDFLNLIKEYQNIGLLMDSNLSVVGGTEVTQEVNELVEEIKPKELILFNSTPLCTEDAKLYFSGHRCAQGYTIPQEVIYGFVADRTHLAHMFINNPGGIKIDRSEEENISSYSP
jgi:uncharacterized protein YlbG (UPF0298 family)